MMTPVMEWKRKRKRTVTILPMMILPMMDDTVQPSYATRNWSDDVPIERYPKRDVAIVANVDYDDATVAAAAAADRCCCCCCCCCYYLYRLWTVKMSLPLLLRIGLLFVNNQALEYYQYQYSDYCNENTYTRLPQPTCRRLLLPAAPTHHHHACRLYAATEVDENEEK